MGPQHNSIESWAYRVRVAKVFRGVVGQTAVVHTQNDSGRLRLEVGRNYLVFANLGNGRLEIGNDCGPLSDPTHANEAMREIQKLRAAREALVEGEVRLGVDGPGRRDVTIKVSGNGKTYQTTSDAHGLFRIIVPPGRYKIDVGSDAGLSDYSRIDPKNVSLVRGQCAQALFLAR